MIRDSGRDLGVHGGTWPASSSGAPHRVPVGELPALVADTQREGARAPVEVRHGRTDVGSEGHDGRAEPRSRAGTRASRRGCTERDQDRSTFASPGVLA
ncbi:MAG: hypothetical protein IPQ07_44215 [Myxococcales bacterium]|nr:hypothetical protein [Myxococcales bacterium]